MLSSADFLTKYFTILTGNCLSFHRSHHPPVKGFTGFTFRSPGQMYARIACAIL